MSDKIWIIKIGLEISGPFNQAEIIAQINNKEILETDQIASSFSRFEFMKNCEEFSLLFKVNDTLTHSEVTKTERSSDTSVISQIDPSVTGFFDITLEKPEGIPQPPYQKLPTKVASDKKINYPIKQKVALPHTGPVKPAPLEQPILIKKTPKYLQIEYLSGILALMVIGVLGLHQYQQFLKGQATDKQNLQKVHEGNFRQSTFYKKIGRPEGYINAENTFKNILHLNPNHPEAFFELIETLILMGKEEPEKLKEAEDLLNSKLQSSVIGIQGRIYNYLALTHLYRRREKIQYDTIQDLLNNALGRNQSFEPARVNLGTAYFLDRKYKEAKQQFDRIKNPELEGIFRIYSTSNAIKYYLNNRENQSLEELIDINSLKNYRDNNYDLKLELSALLALLQFLQGEVQEAREALKDILEMDWDLTDLHFHNVEYYYLNSYFWSDVILGFDEDKDFWKTDPLLPAVEGLFTYKKGDQKTGRKKIEEVFDQNKDLPQITILLAYIEYKSSQENDADDTLDFVRKNVYQERPSPLFYLLKALISIGKNDLERSETHLENLRSSGNFELQALSYLAQVNEDMQDRRSKAREYFEKAKQLSKNYKPLLELEAKWGEE